MAVTLKRPSFYDAYRVNDWVCLSTDTKPTSTTPNFKLYNGDRMYEIDTANFYFYSETDDTWYEAPNDTIIIRNTDDTPITATTSTVQTVATNYMQTKYSRAPKNGDALIITLTDQGNDTVMYVFSSTVSAWCNPGTDINLNNYYTKEQSNSLLAGKQDVLTFDNTPTTGSTNPVTSGGVKSAEDTLQSQINALENIGRYLSIWNCSTGLPLTNPPSLPYAYKSGDYYRVGSVATGGASNYKPDGSSYSGAASSSVEQDPNVAVGWVYYYDGSVWKAQGSGAGGEVMDVQINGTSIVNSGTGVANIIVDDIPQVGSESLIKSGSVAAVVGGVYNAIAPEYSLLTFPIAEGVLCSHSWKMYRSNQAIMSSEEWTAAHWVETSVANELDRMNKISDITIYTPPTKMSYVAGETFAPTGMAIQVRYPTHATKIVTSGYTFSPNRPLTQNDTTITISYTEDGVTKTATLSIIVTSALIYGVCWDYSNSYTELTRLTQATDPNGYVNTTVTGTPSPAVGTASGSSPFDTLYPWSGMDEYNIIDGEVMYRRGETGFSRANHDTMVYIPEFYYKVVDDSENEKRYFYVAPRTKAGFAKHPGSGRYVGRYNTISGYCSKSGAAPLVSITRATARTNSAAKGEGWCQYDYASWCAVWLLYLVEYADWNSQAKIGMGVVSASATVNSGSTDAMTYHTGRTAGTDGQTAVQYRHIENPWGNIWEWIDGINLTERAAYVCTDPSKYADDTTVNYTSTGVTISGDSGGFITKTGYSASAEYAFLPTVSGGSSSTFIPDKMWSGPGWVVLGAGGYWGNGSNAGLFYFSANNASMSANSNFGARLLFIP